MAPPGKQAYSYGFLIYGGEAGYQNARAQIFLAGSTPQDTVAFLRFSDPGVTFPVDSFKNGIVTMYLPMSMFEPTLHILRTEKIVSVYFALGQGVVYTGNLSIGSGAPLHPPVGPPIKPPIASARAAKPKRKKVRPRGAGRTAGRG